MDIDRAGNWQEFTRAIARLAGPGSNFVYADVDGNIGYHAAGALPKRHNYRGDLPMDGTSGNFEWDGYVPFEELPSRRTIRRAGSSCPPIRIRFRRISRIR